MHCKHSIYGWVLNLILQPAYLHAICISRLSKNMFVNVCECFLWKIYSWNIISSFQSCLWMFSMKNILLKYHIFISIMFVNVFYEKYTLEISYLRRHWFLRIFGVRLDMIVIRHFILGPWVGCMVHNVVSWKEMENYR
jgi:hypothetical protein